MKTFLVETSFVITNTIWEPAADSDFLFMAILWFSLFWFLLFVGGGLFLAYQRIDLRTSTFAAGAALVAYTLFGSGAWWWRTTETTPSNRTSASSSSSIETARAGAAGSGAAGP